MVYIYIYIDIDIPDAPSYWNILATNVAILGVKVGNYSIHGASGYVNQCKSAINGTKLNNKWNMLGFELRSECCFDFDLSTIINIINRVTLGEG